MGWPKGKPQTEEHKRKIGIACTNPSDETRAKLSIASTGRKHSEETRRKISESHKGVHLSDETKNKISNSHKGKTISEETREKISKTSSGKNHWNYGKCMSEESKIKNRESNKGKHHWSEEDKKRMSENRKGKGHPHSEETKKKLSEISKNPSAEIRKKMSEGHKWQVGEKSSNWKGGISKKPEYNRVKSQKRRALKNQARGFFTIGEWELLKKQYSYTCPMCLKKEPEIKLTMDHIIPLSKGGSNYIENIQPLCFSCNSRKETKIFRITPKGEKMLF